MKNIPSRGKSCRDSVSRESVGSLKLEKKAEVRLCRIPSGFLRSSDFILREMECH